MHFGNFEGYGFKGQVTVTFPAKAYWLWFAVEDCLV